MPASQVHSSSRAPEGLGEFTLLDVLGRGGSGVVYDARSQRHGRVALKVLHDHLALSARERRRFFEEVERMRRVRHPSLVTLVDAGTLPDGRPYLCMPPLRGETLGARAERGALLLPVALPYFRGLADGVAALHSAGLVHRDIKPENVLLEEAGERAILLDFGIAREIHALATTTTRGGASRGTPAYMAPERLFGMSASVATDIYELAIVFYVMLVGRLPWDEECADARLQPRAPQAYGVHLPSSLVTVLMKALSTRPDARPVSASAFADAAGRIVDAPDNLRPTTVDLLARGESTAPVEEVFEPACDAIVAGRYRLVRLLGQGGMGEVWAAVHVVTRKAVALKFLRANLARKHAYRRRFIREARAASRVRHPNVVQIHDVLELGGGVPVMVMDLLEGESLADRLARRRVLSPEETAELILPVLLAVGTAHRRGIVHRDLKPANIFLATEDERTKVTLLDFGIAKVTGPESVAESTATLTMDGAMLGTPFYMSPEQIYGEPDVDHRSDIWALGVILFECLTGFRPTQAKSIGQVLKIITNREIVPIERLAPHVPPRLAELVMSMLSLKRDDRPPSLEHVFQELAASCVAPLESPPPETGPPRRRFGLGTACLALSLVSAIAGASSSFLTLTKKPAAGALVLRTPPGAPQPTVPAAQSTSPVAGPGVAPAPATAPAETATALALASAPPADHGSEPPPPALPAPLRKRRAARSVTQPAAPSSSNGSDAWLDQR